MNDTLRNLMIGLVASFALAASASATTQPLDGTNLALGSLSFTALNGQSLLDAGNPSCLSIDDPNCGTLLQSHGGQTQGWGYQIQNLSSYWFVATEVVAAPGFTYADPNSAIFSVPLVIAPDGTSTTGDPIGMPYSVGGATQFFSPNTTGLFQITWHTGLTNIVHETGFFTLYGDLYNGNPFTDGAYVGSADGISTPYDASAPEPFSLLLFGTAFGVALWGKSRAAAKRPTVQAERQG